MIARLSEVVHQPVSWEDMSVTSRSDHRIARHIKNLSSEDERASVRAEHNLIRYYGARALSQLILACDHPMPQVRFRAVWALAATRDSRAYETVLRLTLDQDERVRYDATLALGKLGDERAIDALFKMILQKDETRPASLRDFGLRSLEPIRQLLAMRDDELRLVGINDLGWI